jgi:hypothetical protein
MTAVYPAAFALQANQHTFGIRALRRKNIMAIANDVEMRANTLWQKDHAHFLHPWTHFDTFKRDGSLVIESAKGAYVTDAAGRRYLDGIGGLWCVNIGYGRDEMAQAIAEQVLKLSYSNTFTDCTNEPATKLAAKLAIARNNQNLGAGYIERNGEQHLVRVRGQIADLAGLNNIVLDRRDGVPIRVCDVAQVGEGKELRTGAATSNGREVVLGAAFMLIHILTAL